MDDRVVQLQAHLLDVGDEIEVASAGAGDLPDLVALREHRDVGELLPHHVRWCRVDGTLVVVAVPRQDDLLQPREPGLLPQLVDVLRQGLAVALATVVEEETAVDPLERDPRRRVRVEARAPDVEGDVHRVPGVEVERLDALVVDEVHVRLAVHGGGVHLLEADVELLLEHTVVAEAAAVCLALLLELSLGADGR